MATNLTTVNNISCSGSLTISNNIISTGNIQTTNISSTGISNSGTITSNIINGTTSNLTNLSVSNILTLLSSSTPIYFNYNGSNYNISTLMLFRLQELGGISIASQSYVNNQISNLVNSSPDLLNTLSELSAAINNDASFSTTITNLIATKASLSGNNIFSGSNNFGNDVSGNIISRLFSTIVSINNGNARRNVANYFEVGMGATSSYIYYDNTGKFGSINTNDSTLNWNIALNSVFTIKTINSVDETISGTGIVNNLYSNILAINNNNARRSTNDIFECCTTSSTGNYIYYNNTSTFGFINTSNSNFSWFINSSGAATLPSLTTTSLTSTSGSITNLYSNILSINNGTALRAANDLFNVSISSTGNYLYYNSSSVFDHINTSNSASSWLINSSGNAQFPSLTSGVSSISSLSVNSSSVRGSGDLITVSVTPTGNYIYLNNGGVLGCYNTTGIPVNFPWTIDMVGLATFRTVTTLVANGTLNVSGVAQIAKLTINSALRSSNDLFNVSASSTSNYLYYNSDSVFGHIHTNSLYNWYINSSAVCSLQNLCIGSANMRTGTDRLNVSLSNTGSYLFFNDGGTLGTYDTSNSSFPWFIELDGDASFKSVNCKKLSVENIKPKTIVMTPLYEYDLITTSPQMIYLNSASDSIFFNLQPLGESCNFNIYEFRLQTSNVNSIMRFRGSNSTPQCPIIDLNNNSNVLFNDDTKQRYYRFQYIYQFPGGSVINTYYQLK